MHERELTALEARQRRYDERARSGGAVFAFRVDGKAPPPAPEEVAEAARRAKARALPEALFAGDARLQELARTRDAVQAALKNWRDCARDLPALREEIVRRIETASRGAAWLLLGELAQGGRSTEQARQRAQAVAADRALLHAVDAAQALLNAPLGDPSTLRQAAEDAQRAWDDRLMALRLAHVDAEKGQQP